MPSFETFNYSFWQFCNCCFNICYPNVSTTPPLSFPSFVLCCTTALTNTPVFVLPISYFLMRRTQFHTRAHKMWLFPGNFAFLFNCQVLFFTTVAEELMFVTLLQIPVNPCLFVCFHEQIPVGLCSRHCIFYVLCELTRCFEVYCYYLFDLYWLILVLS
jgi:hypothetical protein